MVSAPALQLTIAADWRGEPIAADERRHLALWRSGQELCCRIDAPLAGDPAPVGPPGRLWELWQHEVVELFIAGPADDYLELEFGPHGHYLALQLAGERNIVGYDLLLDEYVVEHEGDRWQGLARVPWALLPAGPHRLNAYAMAGRDGRRQHLALHPLSGESPDFHRLASFRPAEIPAR